MEIKFQRDRCASEEHPLTTPFYRTSEVLIFASPALVEAWLWHYKVVQLGVTAGQDLTHMLIVTRH
ncbi:hypothetical protein ASD86_09350 [Lysobacter sp. Root690]|nr:hypothetical protein ASD86_09350 [Lysobacter sp. Root690]